MKYDVEWCVKSLASFQGMPSKVTLKKPSWKPRMLSDWFSISPGPFGWIDCTLGEIAMMSE